MLFEAFYEYLVHRHRSLPPTAEGIVVMKRLRELLDASDGGRNDETSPRAQTPGEIENYQS